MKYVTIKRYRRDDARGRFNIPYGTEVEEHDGLLWYKGKDICGDHAAVMREYFARNDDGQGLERGRLTRAILKALELRPGPEYQERWDAVWADELCQKYRKNGQQDRFLWNIEFYNAPIEDLKYIAALVGAEKGSKSHV